MTRPDRLVPLLDHLLKLKSTHRTGWLDRGVPPAETESVAGAVNMLSLLETGRDLKGNPRPHLLDLMSRYRVVILPCVNMDGRAVSPDHLRGADLDQFRRASQGYWTDGTEIGYPACKEYAPLPLERVGHPGGYPNADGYNIQHDCCPGDLRTPEARGVLKLVADEQARRLTESDA